MTTTKNASLHCAAQSCGVDIIKLLLDKECLLT